MKSLLLLLSFIPLFLFSQSEVFYTDINLNNIPSRHNYFPNGDRISVFGSTTAGSDLISILKKDATNGLITQTDVILEEFIGSTIYGIVTYNDNSYLIALQHQGSNVSQILLKFSANNTLQWKERIFIPNFTQPYYYNEILDNGQGGAFLMVSESEYAGIININSNGQIQWAQSIVGQNSNGKSPGFSICKNASGGVNGTLKDESYQCVFSLDNNGNEIWSKSHVDMQYRWPKRILQTNDGGFLVAGTFYDYMNNQQNPYITKYTSNGTVQYAKKLNLFTNELWDVQQTLTSEIFILAGSSDNVENIIMIKLDEFANVLDSRIQNNIKESIHTRFINQVNSLGFDAYVNDNVSNPLAFIDFDGDLNSLCTSFTLPDVTSTNDDDFLNAIVNTGININTLYPQLLNDFTLSYPTPYIINTEDYCSYLANPEIASEDVISVYPNPTEDFVTLNMTAANATIEVVDAQGKILQTSTVDNGGTLSLASYETGMYILRVTTENGTSIERISKN